METKTIRVPIHFDQSSGIEPFSVVYPTCGRPELLIRSISALLENEFVPDQIVVVDQSQKTDTAIALERLHSQRIDHVPSTERGLSRARNSGINVCRNAFIAFLDDDCIPTLNWSTAVQAAIHQFPRSALWTGSLCRVEEEVTNPGCYTGPVVQRSLRGKNDPWKIGPTGGNCVYRREVFEKAGLFDPLLGQGSTFPGAEDGDMVFRTLKHQFHATKTGTIRCYHVGWRSDIENVDNAYNYGVGVGAMLAKHVANGEWYWMTAIFVRRFLSKYLALPLNLITGNKHRFSINLKWSQGIIDGYRRWNSMTRGQS